MMSPLSSSQLDVKFWVFSQRTLVETGAGPRVRVCGPKALYASSYVLKQIDYFRDLLSNGFSESSSRATLRSPFPFNELAYTDDYDYESDSDLEDDEYEDSDAGTDSEEEGLSTRERKPIADDTSSIHSDDSPTYDISVLHGRALCREVVIKDVAYKTWRALMRFVHTDQILFNPSLSSDTGRNPDKHLLPKGHEPLCSPKSMYRLSEKLGLTSLQTQSLDAIKSALTPFNILDELLNEYTSLYPAVLELELGYLCHNYNHPDLTSRWPSAIMQLCRGDHPYATEMMVRLLQDQLAPKRHEEKTSVTVLSDDREDELPEWVMCSYGGWAAALGA